MTSVAWESKVRSVTRSSMHPCPGNWMAIGRPVVYLARAAHALSAGIKCWHCITQGICNWNCVILSIPCAWTRRVDYVFTVTPVVGLMAISVCWTRTEANQAGAATERLPSLIYPQARICTPRRFVFRSRVLNPSNVNKMFVQSTRTCHVGIPRILDACAREWYFIHEGTEFSSWNEPLASSTIKILSPSVRNIIL